MKSYILLCFLLSTALYAQAGNRDIIDDEKLLLQYLNQTNFAIDTAAQAVILYEKGTSFIVDGRLTYKLERTIKILGSDALSELSQVEIPYGNNHHEYVRKVSGTTYNLEDGKVVSQSLERSETLKEKFDESVNVLKFNLPAVKKGSVIHYSYIREQPGFFYIPDWDFQSEYPKLYSEYEVNMPSYIIYSAIERVNVPMIAATKNKALDTCTACHVDNSSTDMEVRTWVRRNIPAFKKEDYMGSKENYLERLKIHVTALSNRGYTVHIYNNWNELSNKVFFMDEKGCGQVYSRNGFLEDKVKELTAGKATPLEQGKAIYNYVRDHFSLVSGKKEYDDIKEVFRQQKGSETGINLLLTAMLRKAGLNSAPVLISTRNNERMNMLYPNPRLINCMASTVLIDKQVYFLDASEKQLPFGTLLPVCYNGYCRIVTEAGGSAELEPDNLLNKATLVASLSPDEKDKQKMRLKLQHQPGLFSSIAYRQAWQKDSAKVKIELNKVLNGAEHLSLLSCSIRNMDKPDEKLLIEYEAMLTMNTDAGTLYFDPYFSKFYNNNPFKAASRQYMIEREYKEDLNYVLNIKLPDGYEVDDYPKSAIYKFGASGQIVLKNIMAYQEAEHSFSLNSRLTTNTTLFAPDEYNDLRSFYEKIVEEQHKKIVLKKL